MIRSILSQQVLAGYLFELTGSNDAVAMVRGIFGASQLLGTLPAGFFGDYLRRDTVLKAAGAIGFATSVFTVFAFETCDVRLIYGAFGLWGLFAAVQSPTLEALFADSVPIGQRSWPFTLKFVVLNMALAVGPLAGLLLHSEFGDFSWTIEELRPVVLAGCLLSAFAMVALIQVNDDFAYENQQFVLAMERELQSIERNFDIDGSICNSMARDVTMDDGDDDTDAMIPFCFSPIKTPRTCEFSRLLVSPTSGRNLSGYSTGQMATDEQDATESPTRTARLIKFCGLRAKHVPSVLFASDFITSNGAGMTTSFFPLFLNTQIGVSLVDVQVLQVVQPLCVCVTSLIAQCVGRCTDRMPAIIFTRLAGIIGLFCMTTTTDPSTLGALFLAHTALMQCNVPLRRSLLMDFVPKNNRAKWNSLEGLSMFSWTGSAVVGALLIDAYGYHVCFFVTCGVYITGFLLDLLLVPLTRHASERSLIPRP